MSWLAAATVASAFLGAGSSSKSNKTNVKLARETNEFNAAEAVKARQWAAQQSGKDKKFAFEQGKRDRQYNKAMMGKAAAINRRERVASQKFSVAAAATANQRQRENARVANARSAQAATLATKRARTDARTTRKFNSLEASKARDFAAQERIAATAANVKNALAAEKRGREYAAQDRDEFRSYNDPAAQRARLEAAGMNPLSGSDNSGGYVGNAGPMIPSSTQPGATVAAAAQAAVAAQSSTFDAGTTAAAAVGFSPTAAAYSNSQSVGSVGGGPQASGVTAQVAADNSFGEALMSAAGLVMQSRQYEQEQDLRRTQIQLEQDRISELVNRATSRPIVAGVYGPSVHSTRMARRQVEAAPGQPASDPGWLNPGRDVDRDPVLNTPGNFQVDNAMTGGTISLPGTDGDVMDAGQVLTTAVFGGPQVAWNWAKRGFSRAADNYDVYRQQATQSPSTLSARYR